MDSAARRAGRRGRPTRPSRPFRSGRLKESWLPVVTGLLALTGVAFYALPLAGLAAQAPWSDAVKLVRSPAALQALRLSLIASTAATLLSLLIGGPLAFVLARVWFPGSGLVRGLVVLPMVLPPVVAGVGLLTALGRRGLLGETLYAAGISLPFTTAAAIVAAAFVASPFLVITLEAGLRSVDRRLEDAAATLGASRLRILATVTVPALLPSLVAGASLCWARALGEFGATVIFAGNLQGVTQTGPLAVYQALQTGDFEGAVFLSLILFALSLVVLVLLRGRVGAG